MLRLVEMVLGFLMFPLVLVLALYIRLLEKIGERRWRERGK